ncbi:MAG TPA: hypothetical protein VM243_08500 [Phycisphaerae bacterium]|nr:hypothetical protein [Phycisphaerae bacterium]
MSTTIKLLFDENIGRPLVEAMRPLLHKYEEPVDVAHLLDLLGRHGEQDENWIPELADEEWLVISADRGKKPGPKLPLLCAEFGVRHILIKGALHNLKQFEKARAIIIVWPSLIAARTKPRGTRFLLTMGPKYPVLKEVPAIASAPQRAS